MRFLVKKFLNELQIFLSRIRAILRSFVFCSFRAWRLFFRKLINERLHALNEQNVSIIF